MPDNLIMYYSPLETPDATLLETDPYGGRGCKDKDTELHTIGGVAPKGGDAVFCADGAIAHLTPTMRCATAEYVRFIGEPPADHPFYKLPGCQAIGIRTRNYTRPVFETDRHPMRIEPRGGSWHEVTAEVPSGN